MRDISVTDRSWNVDENGDDMTTDGMDRQSGTSDPVTDAFVAYGYARI
jgi:hypothetical protein